MRGNIAGVDHVVVLVRDLDRAADAYARMGFRLTPRGYHTLGSQNHCLMFGSDYIELLAVPRPHPAMQYFTDFLAAGEGLGAIALATQDAAAAHAELAAAGVGADAPLDFSRPVENLGEARFRIVQLPPELTPGCRMFLCQHFTRGLVWRSGYAAHALGVTEIAGIAVLAAEARGYERLLGARARPIAEGARIDTGTAPIAVCEEERLRQRLGGAALPARARPAVGALFLRVSDRERAAGALRKGGFSPVELKDGALALGADQAHGIALVFG
ncbi:MAG: VOC family protein [Burkholderiales bacterium]|nr:VOC family protein [Burkholderiales bacterium]